MATWDPKRQLWVLDAQELEFFIPTTLPDVNGPTPAHTNVLGNALNNILGGDATNNVLDGGAGNDTIYATAGGKDKIIGGDGIDTVVYSSGGRVEIDLSTGRGADGAYGDTYGGIENIIGSPGHDTLLGNSEDNFIDGGASDPNAYTGDFLRGGGGNDTLDGGDRHDNLVGSEGADVMIGREGDDHYDVDDVRDQVIEAADGGFDWVTTTISLVIPAHVEALDALGAQSFRLTGDGRGNLINGDRGHDTIVGGKGDDILSAASGKDVVKGGAGRDKIGGGVGRDKLYGGTGKDVFTFFEPPVKKNLDRIMDFNAKDDSIWIRTKYEFKKLGKGKDKPAKLKKGFFHIGNEAEDRNDYLIYNPDSGLVMYDRDGSGSAKALAFVNIGKNEKVSYNDFFLMA